MSRIKDLQDRFSITPYESATVFTLAGILLLGMVVRFFQGTWDVPPPVPLPPSTVIETMVPATPPPPAPLPDSGEKSAAPAFPININSATQSDLEQLPGIGPGKAKAILDHRKAHGPFTTIEALNDVKGIGDKIMDQLRPVVRVN